MTIKKDICIENGKVFTSCGAEERLTDNQKMMLNNIETGANIVFDCYRQCGFTTLVLNLLATYLKNRTGDFCLVLDRHNSFVEEKEKLKKILSFYEIECTDVLKDDEKNNTYNKYKITSLNGLASITLTTCSHFLYGERNYKKIFVDNAAFMENDILIKLYNGSTMFAEQIIIGSCHANHWLGKKYEFCEYDFSYIIRHIEEKKEPPYTWFHIYVRWWNDNRFKDIVEGQTNAKFLTPEMKGYLFNNKRKFVVEKIEKIKEALGMEDFIAEINCNQECYGQD